MGEGDPPLGAKYLVLSFLGETKVLSMVNDESIEVAAGWRGGGNQVSIPLINPREDPL